jgi:adenylate cyclase
LQQHLAKNPAMNKARYAFQLHAVLLASTPASTEFDDLKAGRPLERRLNRMERVVAAYRGEIAERLENGLCVSFHSADAALLGACEMQHRCAVLPQLSGHRLALRIGIHQEMILQRSKDGTDNAKKIAAQLALLDDGIVASDAVFNSLNPELRKLTRPLTEVTTELSAHQVDWRQEIPSAAFGSESLSMSSLSSHLPGTVLILRHGLKTLEYSRTSAAATIGRDPQNDLTLVDDRISRNHCRIECRGGRIILTDLSTNGTSILPEGDAEQVIKRASVDLKGKGLLFFGRTFNGERRGGIRYETY